MPASPGPRSRPLRRASALALLVALVATGLAVWVTRTIVADQERRLLKGRTAEVGLFLTNATTDVAAGLATQGGILGATKGDVAAYTDAAADALTRAPGQHLTYAWLRPRADGGWQVLAAAGQALHPGDEVTDPARVTTLTEALHTTKMVASRVFDPDRKLGLALGPPAAPAGTVLYREAVLGPVVNPPRSADTAPYAELNVTLYDTPSVQPDQVLVSTTTKLPLRGTVRRAMLTSGATPWLLTVTARRPLVGGLATAAPWVALGTGLLGSLLIALTVEGAARRRDAALALYASEHQSAETMQRSLLPQLPHLPGLDLSARYLASGTGQQVGGDWFDVFPVTGDRVGIVIGDVIGHDLAAAAAMAQIRAALRAYAVDGAAPAEVVTRLAHLVDVFALTELVTVFYGVLDPATAGGSRLLRYSNAGHLPPLVRHADGSVEPLDEAVSAVIGAPVPVEHVEAQRRLEPRDTLVLFTDGLVEEPGGSLDDAIGQLLDTVATADGDAEQMCDRVLQAMPERTLRDDVALLAVQLQAAAPPAPASRREPADVPAYP